jgi:hypothetical protein
VLRTQSFRYMIDLVFGIWMTSDRFLIYFNFFVFRYARAWLWHMVVGFLFSNGNGNTISWLVLPLLHLEWDITDMYNWESAALAWLYRVLCDCCSRSGVNANLRGCMYLLQVWMWECFPVARLCHHEPHVCSCLFFLYTYFMLSVSLLQYTFVPTVCNPLRLHILILRIVLVNLWVQLYLVSKIWVRISSLFFGQLHDLNCT